MPSPKSGTAGSAISPTDPKDAQEADKADPGEVEKIKAQQRKTKAGKYRSVKVKKFRPPLTDEEKKNKTWIEITLVDGKGNPVPGEPYEVEMPDTSVLSGSLDEKGFARIDGIDPGTCKVTFPEMDGRSWSRA
jgi:hypothetical protein